MNMAKTRVKLDLKGFRTYRRDPTVKAVLDEQARAWAARANAAKRHRKAEYEAVPAADSEHGSVALVHNANIEALLDNNENNTLLHTM